VHDGLQGGKDGPKGALSLHLPSPKTNDEEAKVEKEGEELINSFPSTGIH